MAMDDLRDLSDLLYQESKMRGGAVAAFDSKALPNWARDEKHLAKLSQRGDLPAMLKRIASREWIYVVPDEIVGKKYDELPGEAVLVAIHKQQSPPIYLGVRANGAWIDERDHGDTQARPVN